MSGDGSDIVVMKFGGTSVAGAEQIKRAAGRIVAAREAGKRVVAVLSARGKTTDELVEQAHEISERPVAREMDMLLSTGERISCAWLTSSSVVLPRAESTATTRLPASRAATIRPAARLICSAPATEVPPNFITTMSEPSPVIGC